MEFKTFKILIICGLFLFTSGVKAGLITDTAVDSFIDESTGLEWMDFGINNKYSYNQVREQLVTGGEYEGWELATSSQVYELWSNVFLGNNPKPNYENPNHYGLGQLYITDGENEFGSVFDSIFGVMGYNILLDFDTDIRGLSVGFFEGITGFAYAGFSHMFDILDQPSFFKDNIILEEIGTLEDLFNDDEDLAYSTFLVKTNIAKLSVPVPPMLAIYILVLLGLGIRHNIQVSRF